MQLRFQSPFFDKNQGVFDNDPPQRIPENNSKSNAKSKEM
jgi:hypothetical protein